MTTTTLVMKKKCFILSATLYDIFIKNGSFLHMVQEDMKILDTIWKRKHKWLGDVLRHSGMLRDVSEGRKQREKTTGRIQTWMVDGLI